MKKIIAIILTSFLITTTSMASSVGLRWDANDPTPEGYRVFIRETNQAIYDYDFPVWEGEEIECVIDRLEVGVNYAFVVRAFEGELESEDSDEVYWTAEVNVSEPEELKEEEEPEFQQEDEMWDLDDEIDMEVESDLPNNQTVQMTYPGGQGGCFISTFF